jgi:hypothetical protein
VIHPQLSLALARAGVARDHVRQPAVEHLRRRPLRVDRGLDPQLLEPKAEVQSCDAAADDANVRHVIPRR